MPKKISDQNHRLDNYPEVSNKLTEGDFKVTHPKGLKETDIPSVASQPRELPPSTNGAIKVEKLEDDSQSNQKIDEGIKNTEKLIENTEKLNEEPAKSAKAMSKEAKATIKKELRYLKEQIQGAAEKIIKGFQIPPDLIYDLLIEPYGYFAEPFPFLTEEMKNTLANVMAPATWTRDILQGIAFIGEGSALTVQSLFYHEVKKFLQKQKKQLAKDPTDKKMQMSVARLEKYLSIQSDLLKEKAADFISSFATVSVKSANYIIAAMNQVSPLIKAAGGWSVSFLHVISESITLWRAQKAKTKHEEWMVHIAKDQREKNHALTLLEERKKRQDDLIQEKTKDLTFKELKQILEEKNINLEGKTFENKEDFTALLQDKDFRKEIEEKFLADIETVNVMTRNAIQALSETKVKNEKKFFDFKLNASRINLSLACLSTVLAITLEVLAIAGVIALSASTLAVPGLGFFVLGIAIAAIGLYFFYRYKPNLFKCYVQCVNLRLAFFQIPTQIRNLQHIKKQVEVKNLLQTSARYEELLGELAKKTALDQLAHNKKYKKILERLHIETIKKVNKAEQINEQERLEKIVDELKIKKEKIDKKLDSARIRQNFLEKKVNEWMGPDGTVTKLQNRITEAGNKDFARANNLMTLFKKENEKEAEELNIPLVLVEKIFQNNFEFDKETLKILRDKMGIKTGSIMQEGKIDQEKLMKQLQNFFKMDDSELLVFMKQQLLDNLEKSKLQQAAEAA